MPTWAERQVCVSLPLTVSQIIIRETSCTDLEACFLFPLLGTMHNASGGLGGLCTLTGHLVTLSQERGTGIYIRLTAMGCELQARSPTHSGGGC